MEFLTSPWFIIIIVISILVGNIAAFKYLTPKNLDSFKGKKENDLDRLIELDKKHQQEIKKRDE
ncbi:DUF2897 family protein [Vibrio mangrovi]|uniref:DUF2897 family protein n=1 Tax=Vibrio mangrovi TaxID=474394 RepID=A0A1Y6IVC0_9VIBR|nr:DUF2897 family protein [Vibrio mangrovi]MDW6001534.1 DUF2897 family protein [Vibrio mangrovi]SMS00442.1 hypothetical protein VIM7927_01708 [Vibrio mangrovi]